MSIKGTSVEVIVVLFVFPPPVYMRDRNIYLSPLTGRIEKSIGMPGVWMEYFLFLLYKVVIEISVGMTGVLGGAHCSSLLYTTDRPKRSQRDGFGEAVIDESEALTQIRSSVNSLLQDECSYLYQGFLWTHLLCNGSSGSGCTSCLYRY